MLQELHRRADRTALARAQVGCLRLILLKVGVVRSIRRIVLHLPRAHADPDAWHAIATRCGAVPA